MQPASADAVLLCPPWGGPEYIHADTYDLRHLTPPIGPVFAAARRVSLSVAAVLPRNTSVVQLRKLAPDDCVEIEEQYLNHKFKTVAVYWGALVAAPALHRFRRLLQPL